MKINRRQFLKVIGATATASAVPLPLLGDQKVGYVPGRAIALRQKIPAGEYQFSFFHKTEDRSLWIWHTEMITVEDGMELYASVEMEKGDSVYGLEIHPTDPGVNVSFAAVNSPVYLVTGSFEIAGKGLSFADQVATAL